jgi:hypothetical protein
MLQGLPVTLHRISDDATQDRAFADHDHFDV